MLSKRAPTLRNVTLSITTALLLAACSDGGGGDPGTGTLTLGVSDAPVDGAEEVVVKFTGVEIKPANGEAIYIDYTQPEDTEPSTKSIDLLALQGGLRDFLLDNESLPPGKISWIRLNVNAEADSDYDSYITLNGAQHELCIPSGAESGLKLNTPIEVKEGEHTDFTVEFDLRKSVHAPNGQACYTLRPTLRLLDTNETGSIAGTVNPTRLAAGNCSAADKSDVIYIFSGPNVTPDDMDETEPAPVTTAPVIFDESEGYSYRAAFLEAGEYTVSFTCQADRDNSEEDNIIAFANTANVTVEAGAETRQDF
jgi:hypothetical protein